MDFAKLSVEIDAKHKRAREILEKAAVELQALGFSVGPKKARARKAKAAKDAPESLVPVEPAGGVKTAGIRENLYGNLKDWVTAKALAEKMKVDIKALRIVLGAKDIKKKVERRGERGAYEYRFAGA